MNEAHGSGKEVVSPELITVLVFSQLSLVCKSIKKTNKQNK